MKKKKNIYGRFICIFALITAFILLLNGCGSESFTESDRYSAIRSYMPDESVIDSNDKYILSWNSERQYVSLCDKKSETVWSTVPESFLNEAESGGVAGVRLNSALILDYYDTESMQMKTVYSAVAAVKNGNVSAEITGKSLKVIYDFAKEEISVPLIYSLTDNGLKVSIDVKGIAENSNYVYSLGLLPFFSSVKSTDDKASYLFVPSGSGALMYTDEGTRPVRTVELPVYGADPTYTNTEQAVKENDVRLPIFGIKNADNALLAVITEGAETAAVCAQAGDTDIGYASVYSSFYLRGSDVSYVSGKDGYNEAVYKYTDGIVDINAVSVEYMPLFGENASYSGMAAAYRNMLFEKSNTQDSALLNLQFYGASKIKKSFFGVPYETLETVTSFKDVEKIAEKIKNETNADIWIKMIGFGKSGLDRGKIAEGYGFSSSVGGDKGYKELAEWADENKAELYTDYDCINFSASSKSANTFTGCARTVNGINAYRQFYGPAVPNVAAGSYKYYLLKRSLLPSVTDKLLKETDNISGLSLDTLGNTAYSDYRVQSQYVKANMGNQISQILKKISESHSVSLRQPNSYAAIYAKNIWGIPTASSGYDGLDVDIPFYGMVIKGNRSFSVEPINLADEPRKEFLKAVEVGASLNFALSEKWNNKYILSFDNALNMSQADGLYDVISKYTEEYRALFKAVENSEIVYHGEQAEGITETVFDNGVTVTVNFTDKEYNGLAAMSFGFKAGGKTN